MVNPEDEKLLGMLERAFVNLGAESGPARVMGSQLLKRARQLAAERGVPEARAMAELLQKVQQGRRGEYSGEVSQDSRGSEMGN